jgi:hypothetical protein
MSVPSFSVSRRTLLALAGLPVAARLSGVSFASAQDATPGGIADRGDAGGDPGADPGVAGDGDGPRR